MNVGSKLCEFRVTGERSVKLQTFSSNQPQAICTAIGAQPIPLADLPILTTLQLVMVSGIMYLSGRERKSARRYRICRGDRRKCRRGSAVA